MCDEIEHTIHTARFGGLLSDGGSHVAGRHNSKFLVAAPGDRLWLAVSKSIEEDWRGSAVRVDVSGEAQNVGSQSA
jgi:hypothetical protein